GFPQRPRRRRGVRQHQRAGDPGERWAAVPGASHRRWSGGVEVQEGLTLAGASTTGGVICAASGLTRLTHYHISFYVTQAAIEHSLAECHARIMQLMLRTASEKFGSCLGTDWHRARYDIGTALAITPHQ